MQRTYQDSCPRVSIPQEWFLSSLFQVKWGMGRGVKG